MIRILTLLTAAVALISLAVFADPPREREVVFNNGEVKLAGTLLLPAGEPPHNAVVLVHGSGPGTARGPAVSGRTIRRTRFGNPDFR
jgi:hypothetical protein